MVCLWCILWYILWCVYGVFYGLFMVYFMLYLWCILGVFMVCFIHNFLTTSRKRVKTPENCYISYFHDTQRNYKRPKQDNKKKSIIRTRPQYTFRHACALTPHHQPPYFPSLPQFKPVHHTGLHKRNPVETVSKERPAATRGKLPSVTCVVECDTHYDSYVLPVNN